MLGLKKWYFISYVKASPQIIVPKYFNILCRKAFVPFMFLRRIKFKSSLFFSKKTFSMSNILSLSFKYDSLYSCLRHLFIVHFLNKSFISWVLFSETSLFSFAKNKYYINQDGIVYFLKSRVFLSEILFLLYRNYIKKYSKFLYILSHM